MGCEGFGTKELGFLSRTLHKPYKKTQLLYRTHISLIAKNSSEMNINTVDQKYIEKLKSKNTLVIKFLNLFLLFSYCSANY